MMETLLIHIFITALVKELFYMCILHKEHKVMQLNISITRDKSIFEVGFCHFHCKI